MSRRRGSGRADRHFDFVSHQAPGGRSPQERRSPAAQGPGRGSGQAGEQASVEAIRRLRGRVE